MSSFFSLKLSSRSGFGFGFGLGSCSCQDGPMGPKSKWKKPFDMLRRFRCVQLHDIYRFVFSPMVVKLGQQYYTGNVGGNPPLLHGTRYTLWCMAV